MLYIVVAILFASGCDASQTINVSGDVVKGSGVLLEETRNVPEFSGIDLSGVYEVFVRCGQKQEVLVFGDDNVVPHVKTEVNGNVLKVSLDQSVSTRNKIKLILSANRVNSLKVSGTANVDISRVRNKSLNLEISGAGDMKVEGMSDALEITVSGTGNVDAKNLSAKTAVVDVSGAGNVVLSASDELIASIRGVGNVYYYGNPGKVVETVSGAGKIHRR
jgi:hypothetical protein